MPSVWAFSALLPGLGAHHHGRGLLAHRPGDLAAEPLDRLRRLPRASSSPACRSARRSCRSAGPAAVARARSASVASSRTPAARSRSTSCVLPGSSNHVRTDSASTGPISWVCSSCATGAPGDRVHRSEGIGQHLRSALARRGGCRDRRARAPRPACRLRSICSTTLAAFFSPNRRSISLPSWRVDVVVSAGEVLDRQTRRGRRSPSRARRPAAAR